MSTNDIGAAVQAARIYLTEHPEEARYRDTAATAVLEDGLVCRVEAPDGTTVVTDMPAGVGGTATAPSAGWLNRAGLAACEATVIAMRAAELGVPLERVEVTVDSESDDRGLLGAGHDIPAGPLSTHFAITITSSADADTLRELTEWADHHSPVSDGLRRAVPVTLEVRTAATAP